MTVKECYEQVGANYEDVIKRFGSEKLVVRFAKRFLTDTSFSELQKALEEKDAETAFRAAHTLKGVCVNLGFDSLYEVSSDLTEMLRERKIEEDCFTYFEKVKENYDKLISLLMQVEE